MHTYACLTGFGLSVVPFAPFVVRRIGDGSDDRVAIDHGGARQVLDPRASQAGEQVELVAEVSASPNDAAAWEIEFAGVRVEWPNQYALAASDLRGVPFELWGADGAAVFPQGPYSPPPAAEHMIGPGQTVVATDADGPLRWVDMAYVHDGSEWRQRHIVANSGWVVTSQARAASADGVFAAAARLARHLAA